MSIRPSHQYSCHRSTNWFSSVLRGFRPFSGKRMEFGLKFVMPIYLDHLQNWHGETWIFSRTHGRNCLKFGILVYAGHPGVVHHQNWLDFYQGLLIFVILTEFLFPSGHTTHQLRSLRHQNDVASSFWRNDDVFIASCARWVSYTSQI